MRVGKMAENALKQIKLYQRSTDLLIPRAPFSRLVREVSTCGEDQNSLTPRTMTSLSVLIDHMSSVMSFSM